MRWIAILGVAAGLCAIAALASEPGFRAQMVGGTVDGAAARTKAELDFGSTEALAVRTREREFRIAYQKINTLEYGQNVSRRYAESILISPVLLLSKSRKHFVTLGYVDDSGRQQALVLRVNKSDIRSVLAILEARTGRRIEYQDNEARKRGG